MKSIVLSWVAMIGISSVCFANENLVPAESEVFGNAPEDKGFYVGLAYSHLSQDIDFTTLSTNAELDFHAIMLDVGYKFNPYIAVDGRYNISLGDTDMDDQLDKADVSVLSLFVKPMYPIAPEMDIYVLLGYSLTDVSNTYNLTSIDEGAFSWGAGASYDMTEEFSVFAEYTQFYNDTLNGFDHVLDGFNIGVTYKI